MYKQLYKIGQSQEIVITRSESSFDRASDEAYRYAIMMFGIDEDGHSSKVSEWERSRCYIEMEFESYTRISGEHVYVFNTTPQSEE